jgi:hypothetical protein
MALCLCHQPEDLVIPYIGPEFIAALRNKANSGQNKTVISHEAYCKKGDPIRLSHSLLVNWGSSKRRFPQITSGLSDFAKRWRSRFGVRNTAVPNW